MIMVQWEAGTTPTFSEFHIYRPLFSSSPVQQRPGVRATRAATDAPRWRPSAFYLYTQQV